MTDSGSSFPSDDSRINANQIEGGYKPGERIAGRYLVKKLLGRGGMGMVYLVNDDLTSQTLALKTLLPKYVSNTRAVGRFVREVNTVRQLDHPGIIKILDARQHDELLYYTMEYIEGRSLRSYMKKRGTLGLGSAVRILTLLCLALEHAHTVTVHRDVSPENVMLLKDGSIKLLDFGLAKLEDPGGQQFTAIGISLGKIHYQAPEQQQNAAHVDQRADIYPLGVMFYEMLTGRIPKRYEPITDYAPELPMEANDFLKRALARDPADRFATAKEFRLALSNIYQISVGKKAAALDVPPEDIPLTVPPEAVGERVGVVARVLNYLKGLLGNRK